MVVIQPCLRKKEKKVERPQLRYTTKYLSMQFKGIKERKLRHCQELEGSKGMEQSEILAWILTHMRILVRKGAETWVWCMTVLGS